MLSAKKKIVQDYCGAVGRGDLEMCLRLITEDYTHEFLGSTVLAGKRQLPEVLERIKGFSEALNGDAIFTFDEMVEEGDLVSAVFNGACELTSGKRFDGVYSIVCHFRGDRICFIRELVDTKLADSVLMGS